MQLNILSLFYHYFELYNLTSSLKIKPNIAGISETRLQNGKEPITNISLPNYVYEQLLYIDKALNISCVRT